MALNRFSFYQNFIDVTSSEHQGGERAEATVSERGKGQETLNMTLSTGEEKTFTQLININTAGLAELESLPGIGRVTALNIIDYRSKHGPFTDYDELINVKGIGEKKLEMLKQYVNIR